jgi:hypothetical protein
MTSTEVDWTNFNLNDVVQPKLDSYSLIAKLIHELFAHYDYDVFRLRKEASPLLVRDQYVMETIFTIKPGTKREIFQTKFPHPDITSVEYVELFFALHDHGTEKHVRQNILKKLYKEFGDDFLVMFIRGAARTERFEQYINLWDRRSLQAALRKLETPLMQRDNGLTLMQEQWLVSEYATTENWIDIFFGDKPPKRKYSFEKEVRFYSLSHLNKFIKIFRARYITFTETFWKKNTIPEVVDYLESVKNKHSNIITDLNVVLIRRLGSMFKNGEMSFDDIDTYLVRLYTVRKTSTLQEIKRINRGNPSFGQSILSFIDL